MPFDFQTASPPPAAKPATPPAINVPWPVLAVLGVLIAVHLALWLLGPEWQVWSLYALSFIPSRLGGGDPVAFPQGAQYWSFLSYALLHADAVHLISNSTWLLIFSTPLARRWPAGRYFLLLAATAIAGAFAVLLMHWGEFLMVVGASASVSAVLAAAIPIISGPDYRFTGNEKLDHKALRVLSPLELLSNRKAIALSALFLAAAVLTGASQTVLGTTAFLGEQSIAWEAHVAGFLAGLALFYLLDTQKVSQRQGV